MPATTADTLALVLVGVLGLVVGSFLNVVIARVPAGESIVAPPSACPECKTEIKPYDNIPVLSYLILRGRCRSCGARISVQYPLVEVGCAALWIVVFLRFDGLTWSFVLAAVLLASLLALAVVDAQTFRLPNAITYTTFVMGLVLVVTASAATGEWNRLRDAVISAGAAFLLFWLIAAVGGAAFGEDAMGFGDVKLAAVLGLYLGWLGPRFVVIGLFLGFLVGAVAGIALRAAGRKKKRDPIPFGVFLAIGAFLGMLVADPIADLYLSGLH
ncbi:MAG: prepilin peptidase [Acidimicrobiia bacterium]|nr:prepilin peptidase [Acidimicrobiia bacterium]